ncbi:MAG: hypothetical protein F6K09_39440 [Merismopedia sp. SIO2A8]|nr:hypothetical protein [Symploca sp. SIO2B6]NET54450.1 hypothetical protein [Merismopedia sp. SIO2A8]
MSQQPPKKIWLITEETPKSPTSTGAREGWDTGGMLGEPEETTEVSVRGRVPIPLDKLKQNMGDFVEAVGDLFDQAQQKASKIHLEEIELSVEVNAEGQVSLFGIGGKTGGKGGITLKFKRKE